MKGKIYGTNEYQPKINLWMPIQVTQSLLNKIFKREIKTMAPMCVEPKPYKDQNLTM